MNEVSERTAYELLKENTALRADLARLKAENRKRDGKVLALLKEIEWVRRVEMANYVYDFCPSCFADRQMMRGGHTTWCKLDVLLKELGTDR